MQTISEEKLSFPRMRESRKPLYFIRTINAISESDRNYLAIFWFFWQVFIFLAIFWQFSGNFSDYLSAIARNIIAILTQYYCNIIEK